MPIAVIFPLVAPPFAPKSATRFFAKIDSREVFLRCVEIYTPREQVAQRIISVPPDELETMQERYSAHLGFQGVTVSAGGPDWFTCIGHALPKLDPAIDTIIIHDPSCPGVPFTLLDTLEEALAKNKSLGGVVPTIPSRSAFSDTNPDKTLLEYVDMAAVSEVQSPQIFRREALVESYAKREGNIFVDDAELLLSLAYKVATVPGSRFNQRIDSDEMVRLGKDLINHMPKPKSKTPLTPFGEAEW